MAKNQVEVANMGSTSQDIDTSIDMKLSKQDLIDMVIEETRDRLETQAASANEEARVARSAIDQALKNANKQFENAIRAKYKAEFAVLAKYGGEAKEAQISNQMYITELGLFDYEELRSRTNDRKNDTLAMTSRESVSLRTQFQVPSCMMASNKKADYRRRNAANLGQVDLDINLTCTLTATEMKKLYAPMTVLIKSFVEKETAVQDLRSQLGSVDKMGKKAKSQLIKRLLESSEGGQAILTNMGAIKSSVSALLLANISKTE